MKTSDNSSNGCHLVSRKFDPPIMSFLPLKTLSSYSAMDSQGEGSSGMVVSHGGGGGGDWNQDIASQELKW